MQPKNFTNKIVFKKYQIKKIISASNFSTVYEGINKTNNTPVALKIEKDNHLKLLESEAYFLLFLKGFGIPKIISYGKSGNYNILIEELLGQNLEALWEKYGFKEDPFVKKNKNLKDICLIAIQGLERIKFIHSKNIIHRDIKPTNFIIGRKDPNNIYLIDFGFSRKFRSSRTGKHIKYANKHKLVGSISYSSLNGLKGYEISRRDDLESLGFVLIYLAKGLWLPWNKYNDSPLEKIELIKIIAKMKMEISEENLCKGLPFEFISYMKYVKHLEFEEDPDYKYLNSLFLSVLSRNEFKNNLNFFWITKLKSKPLLKKAYSEKEKEEFNKEFKKLNSDQIKESSKTRLFNTIKKSLNKSRTLKDFYQRDNTNKLCEKNSFQTEHKIRNNAFLKTEIYTELKTKMKLDDDPKTNEKLSDDNKTIFPCNNSKNFNFKEEYLKKKKTNFKYIPKEFDKINLINHITKIMPNINIYNEINYNNLYFLDDNFDMRKSSFNELDTPENF